MRKLRRVGFLFNQGKIFPIVSDEWKMKTRLVDENEVNGFVSYLTKIILFSSITSLTNCSVLGVELKIKKETMKKRG